MSDVKTNNIKVFLLALIKQGVKEFVVSPGSRSTPVVLLLSEIVKKQSDLEMYVDVDERSASFFALGLAKDSQRPVVMICTSGTAAAEYSAAMAEAHLSQIPLIAITTDRPMELSNINAPQAIDQTNLYGKNVKEFVQLNMQDDAKEVPDYIGFETQRLVISATQIPKGPIQFNLPFRKPLMPELNATDPKVTPITVPNVTATYDFKNEFSQENMKLLIVAGPEIGSTHQEILKLAKKLHAPILADVLSNTRGNNDLIINNFDTLMKNLSADQLKDYQPDMILRFGGTLVSANASKWLKEISSETKVCYFGDNDLSDHTLSTNRYYPGNPNDLIASIGQMDIQIDLRFTDDWIALNRQVENEKLKYLVGNISELAIPRILDENISKIANIFLSNSMAIRDFENYYHGSGERSIYCNRGANGIDGVISTAIGTSANSTSNYLVIGDLAFFHDMNGLMMAKRYQIPLTIIVINNDGGGIFSFLPQAEAKDSFEELFGTPQDLDFDQVAKLYNFRYFQVRDEDSLVDSLNDVSDFKVIEIKSNRETNLRNHRLLNERIKKELMRYVTGERQGSKL